MALKSIKNLDKPIVSIGMPVYNDCQYLAQALEDILAQSFTNFELIISDNSSTDSTEDICREYASKDKRIHYYRQTQNIGPQGNFTYVFHKASAEFFMWAASDDRWHKDFISVLLDSIRGDESYVSAFCPFIYIDEDNNPLHGRLGGTKIFDFSSPSTLDRIWKFTWTSDNGKDAWIYGLHRKKLIEELKFPVWWWINSNIPLNTAYPILIFFLSRGGYVIVGESPLWFKRYHINAQIRYPIKLLGKPLASWGALLLRQVNLCYESSLSVYQGTKSIYVTLAAITIFSVKCLYTSITKTLSGFMQLGRR